MVGYRTGPGSMMSSASSSNMIKAEGFTAHLEQRGSAIVVSMGKRRHGRAREAEGVPRRGRSTGEVGPRQGGPLRVRRAVLHELLVPLLAAPPIHQYRRGLLRRPSNTPRGSSRIPSCAGSKRASTRCAPTRRTSYSSNRCPAFSVHEVSGSSDMTHTRKKATWWKAVGAALPLGLAALCAARSGMAQVSSVPAQIQAESP